MQVNITYMDGMGNPSNTKLEKQKQPTGISNTLRKNVETKVDGMNENIMTTKFEKTCETS